MHPSKNRVQRAPLRLPELAADGGYTRPELWLSLGRDWVQAGQHDMPFYWERSSQSTDATSAYCNFTLQGMVDIDPNTPAYHPNFFEADALAR